MPKEGVSRGSEGSSMDNTEEREGNSEVMMGWK